MSTGYLISPHGTINLVLNGKPQPPINKDHINYRSIKDALNAQTFDIIESLIDVSNLGANALKNTSIDVKIENGVVYYKNNPVDQRLTDRVISLQREGFKVDYFLKFIDNLYQNPSYNSIKQLYDFMENKCIPITEDGYLLAYKTILSNYYDKYTGRTHINTPGALIKEPRNQIDDNPKSHCSKGLHAGAIEYARDYYYSVGDKVVIVKINPMNVVSVPDDHS